MHQLRDSQEQILLELARGQGVVNDNKSNLNSSNKISICVTAVQ